MSGQQDAPKDPSARLLWLQGMAREKQVESDRLQVDARRLEVQATKRGVQAGTLRRKARGLRERSRTATEKGKRVRGIGDPVEGLLKTSKYQEKASRLLRAAREAESKAAAIDREAVRLRQEARSKQLSRDRLLRQVSQFEGEIQVLEEAS